MHDDTPDLSPSSRIARDLALVRRIRDGEGEALSTLARLYGQWLLDVSLNLVHSPDLAQDVVQDVFTHLWDTRHQINIHGSVSAYLYRATANRSYNLLKHERAHQSAAARFLELEDGSQVDNEGALALDRADVRAAFEKALKRLPPRTRDVFLMRAEQEMSYDEIAAALDIAVSTAYKQVYLASKQLAQLLSMWVDPEGK
jgi:RNA polymerase sigma-70 factor (ECF subfamily)